MEALSWTGSLSFLSPILLAAIGVLLIALILKAVLSSFIAETDPIVQSDGTLVSPSMNPLDLANFAIVWSLIIGIGVCGVFILAGMMLGSSGGIVGAMMRQLAPVWIGLAVIMISSWIYRDRLGLYGQIYDHPLGLIGLFLVLFWILTAIFASWVATHDPLVQISGLIRAEPGSALSEELLERGNYSHYLLGGDALARDVFSRVVYGAQIVLVIAPLATLLAYMVGITLGLPAGFYAGTLDTVLTFIANLVLAFPVILLFYLLVTKDVVSTGIPNMLAAVLFLFPVVFLLTLVFTRYSRRPEVLTPLMAVTGLTSFVIYLNLVFAPINAPSNVAAQTLDGIARLIDPLRIFDMDSNLLNIFVAVVFVNSPTVFRIVRGLVIDIKTRDYVAAAQTRGEGPWYIMLWEILPNTRGPLIVDFCLRIGYTTILLGTLGFFGLGFSPESADWGSTINEGRKQLALAIYPAVAPALALMSLVLGLNFLADGLREESLRD